MDKARQRCMLLVGFYFGVDEMGLGIFSLKMAATCFIFCAFIGLVIEHEIFSENKFARLLGFFSMSCGALFMMTALMSFIWLS